MRPNLKLSLQSDSSLSSASGEEDNTETAQVGMLIYCHLLVVELNLFFRYLDSAKNS